MTKSRVGPFSFRYVCHEVLDPIWSDSYYSARNLALFCFVFGVAILLVPCAIDAVLELGVPDDLRAVQDTSNEWKRSAFANKDRQIFLGLIPVNLFSCMSGAKTVVLLGLSYPGPTLYSMEITKMKEDAICLSVLLSRLQYRQALTAFDLLDFLGAFAVFVAFFFVNCPFMAS